MRSAESLVRQLIGARLESVVRLSHNWEFSFGPDSSMMFESLWRLISDESIVVTSEDDGQKFGLKVPIRAADVLKARVGERLISDVRVDKATSDLRFWFGQNLRLEVISTSFGYEAWNLHVRGAQIIGRNGDTVIFPPPNYE